MSLKLSLIKKYSSLPKDEFTRKIIQGENLDVLDLLFQVYNGKVKCIYTEIITMELLLN